MDRGKERKMEGKKEREKKKRWGYVSLNGEKRLPQKKKKRDKYMRFIAY